MVGGVEGRVVVWCSMGGWGVKGRCGWLWLGCVGYCLEIFGFGW